MIIKNRFKIIDKNRFKIIDSFSIGDTSNTDIRFEY